LVAAGCSTKESVKPSASQARPEDPCRLLDTADVETVLGEPAGPPYDPSTTGYPPFGVVGMRFCALRPGSIQVGVASTYARDVFEQHNARPINADIYKPVEGFGDEAVAFTGGSHKMLVLQGRHVVGISIVFGRNEVPYEQERSDRAMTKILQRLEP
jgi:hypothetical protein